MSYLGDLGTFLKGERGGVTLELDNKLNAIAPYSGYLAVSKKLDNFYFKAGTDFIASMADKNRYVKFLDKVVDTWGIDKTDNNWLYVSGITGVSTSSINETSIILEGRTYDGYYDAITLEAGVYRIKSNIINPTNSEARIYVSNSIGGAQLIEKKQTTDFDFELIVPTTTNVFIECRLGNHTNKIVFTKPMVKKIQSINLSNYVPDVLVQDEATNGLTLQTSVNAGDYIVVDRKVVSGLQGSAGTTNYVDLDDTSGFYVGQKVVVIDSSYNHIITSNIQIVGSNYIYLTSSYTRTIDTYVVKQADETYRAKIDAPIGTSLTNTTYFEVRDSIGVTNQIGVFHKYNVLTNSYEGLSAEILFSDVSKEDLLDNPVWLSRNGFSKSGEYCYSKGVYLYLPVSIWQTLNKGAYHPVFNGFGTCAYGNTTFGTAGRAKWYDSTVLSNDSTALAFINKTQDSLGRDDGSILGTADSVFPRPDNKFYDIVYPDQVIDIREYARTLNKWEVDLIWRDKEDNGVEEVVSTVRTRNYDVGTNLFMYIDDVYTNYVHMLNKYIVYMESGTTPTIRQILAVNAWSSPANSTQFVLNATVNRDNGYALITKKLPILSSNTKLSTDLIGNPTNYLNIMKDRLAEGKGIIGVNPLLVGQDGTSYIFTAGGSAILSNKSLQTANQAEIYLEGSTGLWGLRTLAFNQITNTLTIDSTAGGSDDLVLKNYTSKNQPYIQTTPKAVVEVLQKVKASNSHSIYKGALVGNQIAGKIQVGNGTNGYESKVLEYIMNPVTITSEIYIGKTSVTFTTNNYYLLTDDKFTYANKGEVYKWKGSNTTVTVDDFTFNDSTYWDFAGYVTILAHSTIALDNSNSPASKWFEVLEEGSNGVLAGVYGKELAYNLGTTSYDGDNELFDQLTNGTKTDLNGATVRTFHGSIAINGRIK